MNSSLINLGKGLSDISINFSAILLIFAGVGAFVLAVIIISIIQKIRINNAILRTEKHLQKITEQLDQISHQISGEAPKANPTELPQAQPVQAEAVEPVQNITENQA